MTTPIYLKQGDDWLPDDDFAYVLSKSGLFVFRNERFFRSCTPARKWPRELDAQDAFVELKFPKIPQVLFERIVGFCDAVGRHGSEAIVLLTWNDERGYEVLVPPQVGVISYGWTGKAWPLRVEYDVPPMRPDVMLLGDVHSHVDYVATVSAMDSRDQDHFPGIHIIVGDLFRHGDPPDMKIVVTVDGTDFPVDDPTHILEGYERRRTDSIPTEWLEKVELESWSGGKSYRWSLDDYAPAQSEPATMEGEVVDESREDCIDSAVETDRYH